MNSDPSHSSAGGPLDGVRVLDLSRILAGPTCTQLLGDMGADVLKVERPGAGDDTRKWGPPYVRDGEGRDTSESAYYLCANRNKRSLAIDMATEKGAAVIRDLAAKSDILIENFKVGGMARFGLAYEDLRETCPGLIYCSISGFGQSGPYAGRSGYDFLVQAMGGIMSLTGEPGGEPMKVGVGIADVMCGMYACSAILAALHHREKTGEGQYIDISLADTQLAWLINEGTNYLTSGELPRRRGNAHPNIVPYQLMPASDGPFILAVGNDRQFRRFCTFAGAAELADDARFASNRARVANREELIGKLTEITRRHPARYWMEHLEALGVPCGPVNDVAQAFDDPQFRHRQMRIAMDHPLAGSGKVELIGNPLKFSRTPVLYERPPPLLGQHTAEILREVLGMDEAQIRALQDSDETE